jgi:hypothetical protein
MDDDGYDDDADDSNADDIDGDGDGDTFSKELSVQKVAQCQKVLSQFSPEVCGAVISPLSTCIENRIASDKASDTEVFYPLTTRSVERMFSYWK